MAQQDDLLKATLTGTQITLIEDSFRRLRRELNPTQTNVS